MSNKIKKKYKFQKSNHANALFIFFGFV